MKGRGCEITEEFGRGFSVLLYTDSVKLNFSPAENVKLLITHVDFGSTRQTPLFQPPTQSHPHPFADFWNPTRHPVSVIKTQMPLSSGIHNGLGTWCGFNPSSVTC